MISRFASALGLAAAILSAIGGSAVASSARVLQVARYGVFEQPLSIRTTVAAPWEQVSVDVKLVSPSRRTTTVSAFYVSGDRWAFRFAPTQVGHWRWTATARGGSLVGAAGGRFAVVKSRSPGFVRTSPYNSLRWAFTNGAPYYPIGLNDCTNVNGARAEFWGLDGGVRPSSGHGSGTLVGIDKYMRAYSAAGFDLFRWGPDNCSFALYQRIDPTGNMYSADGMASADRLFRTLRRYGFRIEMVIFGGNPPFASSTDSRELAAVDRYVDYVVARYGALVDFWELTNEASPSDDWIATVARHLQLVDPYHHPVGTSWSRPQLPVMQFGSDHWYQSEDALQSDAITWARVRGEAAASLGKPTLIDEQGNTGINWDASSALRLRLRSWTAFFAEGTFVFWNTSFIKNCCPNGAMSIYIGPQERGYVRVLQSYTARFDPRAKVTAAQVAPGTPARAYALRGPRMYGVYIVSTNRSRPTSGVRVTVDPARGGTATWIDPASGRVLQRTRVRARSQTLVVPSFMVDVALKIA